MRVKETKGDEKKRKKVVYEKEEIKNFFSLSPAYNSRKT